MTDVISLLQSHEVRELELTREVEIASDVGLSFEEFPIPDRGVPESVEATHALWARIEAKSATGVPWGFTAEQASGAPD